ncbi:MAG: DUF4910 domain-containing protein [Bradymonadales bacterium]|nr:MAG: DUF4910 domain-containing protein [Bradymonadales bacterium]
MTGIGETLYQWVSEVYPHRRSLSSPGTIQTLEFLKGKLPNLKTHEFPSGQKVFDWTIPPEWHVESAFLEDGSGVRILDYENHALHLVGYSIPVDQSLSLDELQTHLHSLPEQPSAIPYVTSYYQPRWGFCLTHDQRLKLVPGKYRALIESRFIPGVLRVGELFVEGETEDEILFSTYICHPMMANNESSGIVVTTALAQWVSQLERRRFSYRFLFAPETIGSIAYLSQNLPQLQKNLKAGFVVTCVGDDRDYSYLSSRAEDSLADRAARHVLQYHHPSYKTYSFLERGSDERQYCSPGVDLPVCSIMRTKYGQYPEYHSSLDNLSVVSPSGLEGSFEAYKKCIMALEANTHYRRRGPCEPHLSSRGLYPSLSKKGSASNTRTLMNLLAYFDGKRDLIEVCDKIGADLIESLPIIESLLEHELIEVVE